MKLQEILDSWTGDATIDELALDTEALRIPILHAKYIQMYSTEALMLGRYNRLLRELTKDKWEWYGGKKTAQEYKEAGQFNPLKVIRQDIPTYIDADPEYNELKDKILMAEQKVQVLKEIMQSINNRNWVIKNAIERQRFLQGG